MKKLSALFVLVFTGTLLHAQWSKVNREQGDPLHSYQIKFLNFQNEDTVFCTNNFTSTQGIFYSTDGGDNFKFFGNLLTAWGGIQYMRFIAPDTVLAVTGRGILKISSNKSELPKFVVEFVDFDSTMNNESAETIFWHRDSGLVNSRIAFKTIDGGKNWVLVNGIKNENRISGLGLLFQKNYNRLVANDGYFLFESFDRGSTWDTLFNFRPLIPNFDYVNSLSFPTDDVGYAATKQIIFKTTDGGEHWDTLLKVNSSTFYSLVAVDEESYYFIYEGTNILFKYNRYTRKFEQEFVLPTQEGATEKLFYYNDSLFFLVTSSGSVYKRSKLPLKTETIAKKELAVTIYPNPVTENLNIVLPVEFVSSRQSIQIHLTDLNGKLLFSSHYIEANNYIDFSYYPSGLYILSIKSGSIMYRCKILKQ